MKRNFSVHNSSHTSTPNLYYKENSNKKRKYFCKQQQHQQHQGIMDKEGTQLDLDLYSRQYYVYGGKAMSKMAQAAVFLSGLGGLGIEIAKNVTLAGVKRIVLHDTQPVSMLDLSTQFFLSESDIGKNRAIVSHNQVKELNPYVSVDTFTDDLNSLDLNYFKQFTCIILTETPLSLQLKINDFCHQNNIAFISADVRGLFCWCFCDFGTNFEITDKNGEEPKEFLIDNVTQANPGIVTVLDKGTHDLEDGSLVKFREVKGMIELNNNEEDQQQQQRVFPVNTINSFSFTIGDTSSFSSYESGGIATQVKKIIKMDFVSLREALTQPDKTMIVDWTKMMAPSQMLLGMQALDAFRDKHGHLPQPWNLEDANEVLGLAKEINDKSSSKICETIDEQIFQRMAFTAQGSLVGITSFLGGVAAQEAIKSVTSKFTPLNQWLFVDFVELLPEQPDGSLFQPQNTRYDAQIICIGQDLHNKITESSLFMIGAGAIGCEMLKNFALLGVSTGGQNGKITVTDNDVIEKSNLNRQFLFRPHDIQQPKSTTAAKAALRMNPALHIDAHLKKVGPDTEDVYSDPFFKSLDFVVNALDNIAARMYVDQRCVTNQRALLESGTLATKGHVQVIVPHLTESYGSRRDPPEKDVPFCTLKSFPNNIEHCIQWARDKFASVYSLQPQELNKALDDPYFVQRLKETPSQSLMTARRALKVMDNRPNSFDDCVAWARIKFQKYFYNKLVQLLHVYPRDMETKEGGKFWSGAKRPPVVQEFDIDNPHHVDFVRYAACLWAKVWGIEPIHFDSLNEADNLYIKKICSNVIVPPFKPKDNKVIETDTSVSAKDAAEKQQDSTTPDDLDEHLIAELASKLERHLANKENFRMYPEEFEKDNDSNFHIDYITATSNLRADSYAIAHADRLTTKRIAGRIMPAIATTTAAVSGLVSIEMIKLVKKCTVMEVYKNAFLNLGLPLLQFAEPSPAEKTQITPNVSISLWDQWEIRMGDITVAQFCDYFKEKYNLTVTGIFQGVQMVYVPIMPGHSKRLKQKLRRFITRETGQKYIDLIVTFENDDGTDVNGPPVRFWMVTKKRKHSEK